LVHEPPPKMQIVKEWAHFGTQPLKPGNYEHIVAQ